MKYGERERLRGAFTGDLPPASSALEVNADARLATTAG